MTKLHIDLETYSEADLKKVGLYRYAADPSTKITLFGYAFDREPARVVDIYAGEPLPGHVFAAMANPDVQKIAHNAMFERVVLRHVWGIDIPPEQWFCTMIHARSLALPGALGLLTRAIGTSVQKIEDRTLIPRLCTPRYGGIAKNIRLWPSFKEYNRIDVESEREAGDKLARFPMPPHEWRLWHLDQKINDRGMPIDMTFVELASNAIEDLVKEATDTVKLQTAMANPNSRAQWLSWLQTRDVKAEDLTAGTVDALRADEDVDPDVRSMLDLRKELASASVKKFETLTRSVVDDRMRGAFSFAGAARTGRWSGKGFQPHNLPRGVLEVEELELARDLIERNDRAMVSTLWGEVSPVVASLVRTAIAAPPGRKIVAADLASIETVMGAWAAGCRPLLKVFEDGLDAYKDYATHLFHVEYHAVTKRQRKLSKPGMLGAGYGMGARGLQKYALQFGVVLTMDEAREHVRIYRTKYKAIVDFWEEIEQAAFSAIENRSTERAGEFQFRFCSPFLFIDLPSGRSLAYFKPHLAEGRFGTEMRYLSGAEYNNKVWLSTYGPKLFENIVQAISRDVLAGGLMRSDAAGMDIVLHVHDEIAAEADEDDDQALPTLIECMTRKLPWCADAPIKAAGWEGKLYRKD